MALKKKLIRIVKNCKMVGEWPWANCEPGGNRTCKIYDIVASSASGASPLMRKSGKGKGAKKRIIVCFKNGKSRVYKMKTRRTARKKAAKKASRKK